MDTSDDLMPVKDRPRVINKFSMPAGNYDTWTQQQAYEAELLAKLFANSYILDFSPTNTALRLGSTSVESAAVQGCLIANHWLTQHYVRKLIDSFGDTGVCTDHSVRSLLWRDASDFSPGANPMARVSAQKCLAQGLGLTETQAKRKAKDDLDKIRGGVIWVEARSTSLPDWEEVSLPQQKAMMERLEDDTPVEGADLL